MGTKHTPGPWRYFGNGCVRGGAPVEKVRGSAQPQVAVVVGGETIDVDEREANARLIAAAPDLLDALRIRLAIDDDLERRGSMPEAEIQARLKEADRLMRAAKAKAESSR